MIKVCIFFLNANSAFDKYTSAPQGGAQIQLINIATALVKDPNFKVSLITGDWGNRNILEYKGISIIYSAKLRLPFYYYPLSLFKIIKSLINADADIYLTTAAGPETGILGLYCKLANKKFVFRSANSGDCTNDCLKRLGWWKSLLYKSGLKCADLVIVQNNQDRENLKKYYYLNSTVIRNMTDIKYFKSKFKREFVLWVGRSAPIKDPEAFLKIAKLLPEIKFVMIMTKSANDGGLFDKICSEAKKIKNLELKDFVPPEKISDYFNKSIAFINTSFSEGYPNTFLEACNSGTPIGSLRVDPDQVISKFRLGFWADNNPDKLIDWILKLKNNPKSVNEYGKYALYYLNKYHDSKKVSKEWINYLSRLKTA
jgi:glycosyltransferase involved in cell wall biosynthesis